MLKLTSQLLFLNPCGCVSFKPKPRGSRECSFHNVPAPVNPTGCPPPPPEEWAEDGGPYRDSKGTAKGPQRASVAKALPPSTPTQEEIPYFQPDYSSPVWLPSNQNVLPPLEKKNTRICTPIYIIFFVFTFKYKNTTLLCVINEGPSS